MNIAFFHGLESEPISDKSQYLHKHYTNAYTPALDYKTNKTIFKDILTEIYNLDYKLDLLIGSSFGGFLAFKLSTHLNLPTLLFNPALSRQPYKIDTSTGFYSNKHKVVLGLTDDVIIPKTTEDRIKSKKSHKWDLNYENIGHRTPIDIFTKYLDKI